MLLSGKYIYVDIKRKGDPILNKKIVIVLLLPFLIMGCTAQENLNNNESDISQNTVINDEKIFAYFPMLVGMHYEYKGEGIEYAAFIRDIKHIKQPFMQIHDNNGGTTVATIYKVEAEKISIISQQEEFYSDRNLLSEIDKEVQEKEVLLKAPIKKGTAWETNGMKKEIVETRLVLEVPAGKFYDVIKIKEFLLNGESDMVHYSYFAKNIGLIKRESIGDNFSIISELKTYENLHAEKDSG